MWLTRACLAAAVALAISGCALQNLNLSQLLPEKTKTRRVMLNPGQLQSNLDARLAANDYLAALALIGSAIHQGQPEERFKKHYPKALNGVLHEALQLQQASQARNAGSLYRTARLNYPHSPDLRAQASMSLTEIDASIELCANRILEDGLQFYRKGQLEEAIAHWGQIASFHPDHGASQRAVATTRTQLSNLQRLDQE